MRLRNVEKLLRLFCQLKQRGVERLRKVEEHHGEDLFLQPAAV